MSYSRLGLCCLVISLASQLSAAAMVEPEPMKGSRTTPSPSGSRARTRMRMKCCGLRQGWSEMASSQSGVRPLAITSGSGLSAERRRSPPVFQRRRFSATVFSEIGLELKAQSPLKPSFTIELANGGYGYLPTPKQHKLGGYETWLGTNKVEVQASTKIVNVLLEMFAELK